MSIFLTTNSLCDKVVPSQSHHIHDETTRMKNEVIYCSGMYTVSDQRISCAFGEGLPEEMASFAKLDHRITRCTVSNESSVSIQCRLCKRVQYCCLLCKVVLRRKKHLMQHIEKSRKHVHLVQKVVDLAEGTNLVLCPPVNTSTRQPNEHLNNEFMSPNNDPFLDDDDDSLFNDTPVK